MLEMVTQGDSLRCYGPVIIRKAGAQRASEALLARYCLKLLVVPSALLPPRGVDPCAGMESTLCLLKASGQGTYSPLPSLLPPILCPPSSHLSFLLSSPPALQNHPRLPLVTFLVSSLFLLSLSLGELCWMLNSLLSISEAMLLAVEWGRRKLTLRLLKIL